MSNCVQLSHVILMNFATLIAEAVLLVAC